ncbi:SCO family protein [Pseudomonas sp. UL073]|uniref:SCO family protein n=1 Tax=Zestomonas insulae TaxID=2809017 RepID=A0ABS2IKP6_9GAMM|nr:SCO family protein [Pseudomonas insulae]MBM7062540.1 SCO family protein [Pseudomonas insulae]
MAGKLIVGALLGVALLGAISLAVLHGRAAGPVAPPTEAKGSPWGREYFPNPELISQDGRRLRFYDDLIAGKVVAINFIFTGCGDSCPLETARLRQVQKLLGARVGQDIHFYSISIDPLHDTPAVLKQFADKFQVGPGWLFLTGDFAEISALREKLGLLAAGDDPAQLGNHNLSMIIGNQASGRWMKASPFENPYILADRLGNSLHNWQAADSHPNDYAQAPALRTPSAGEQLYRTRCSACHTLGEQHASELRAIGPDLLGVTRLRERDWLRRWLKAPDALLKQHDPLAVQLYERYNRVAMPNLRLGDVEVEALLGYLEDETERLQPRRAGSAQAAVVR